MATFCYAHPKTEAVMELNFPCGKAPPHILLDDGTVCERSIPAEIMGQGCKVFKPCFSRALAVHSSQASRFTELSKLAGCETRHDSKGRPCFQTKEQRKKYAEWRGATDMDGGYGDPFSG